MEEKNSFFIKKLAYVLLLFLPFSFAISANTSVNKEGSNEGSIDRRAYDFNVYGQMDPVTHNLIPPKDCSYFCADESVVSELSKYVKINISSKVINSEKSGSSFIDKINIIDSSIGFTASNKGVTLKEIMLNSSTSDEFRKYILSADHLITSVRTLIPLLLLISGNNVLR